MNTANVMALADAYADASFDQGLDRTENDQKPEAARAELEVAVNEQAAEIERLKESVSDLRASTATLARERNALQAKLSAMEKHEPVAWMSPGKERLEFSRNDTVYGSHTIPLYTAPKVAQQPCLHDWLDATDGRFCLICHASEAAIGGQQP